MSSGSRPAMPWNPEAYTTGNSHCSSVAPREQKRSKVVSTTQSGLAPSRSILLTTTTTFFWSSSAFFRTKRVWGMGPSMASTRSNTPSTMLRTRSTSPPKSAWPGVSMMFTFVSLYVTAVFLERMVMPRSRSRSLLSITRVSTFSFSRNTLDCASMESTSVVLPWSTCAMMATLRTSSRFTSLPVVVVAAPPPPGCGRRARRDASRRASRANERAPRRGRRRAPRRRRGPASCWGGEREVVARENERGAEEVTTRAAAAANAMRRDARRRFSWRPALSGLSVDVAVLSWPQKSPGPGVPDFARVLES